jgi:isocitrate dehydrogenase (NAD+)
MQAVLIEGDGVGPEVVRAAVAAVEATGVDVEWEEAPAGWSAYERYGHPAPASTLDAVRRAGAALKGPFYTPSGGAVRSANFYFRHDLDLYACVRPIESLDGAVDVLLVRENVEDLYGAVEWTAAPGVAHAVKIATRRGSRRIAEFAFELAARRGRERVTVVHKANNLKLTEGLFLETARAAAAAYPQIELDDLLADAAAAELVSSPQTFDVILTSNSFGDLLANVGAAVVGSLGVVPSLNQSSDCVVVEPGHGSADELAGTGRANPLATIAAAGMMLERFSYTREAEALHAGVRAVRAEGLVTPDLGGDATTAEVATEVCRRIARFRTPVTATA